jgi:amidophosphoribosyltransferase
LIKTTDNGDCDDDMVKSFNGEMSIIKMMDRLNPKRIVVVSSPQIKVSNFVMGSTWLSKV